MFSAMERAVFGFPVTLTVGDTGAPMALPLPVGMAMAIGLWSDKSRILSVSLHGRFGEPAEGTAHQVVGVNSLC